jgi:hypothetical protein
MSRSHKSDPYSVHDRASTSLKGRTIGIQRSKMTAYLLSCVLSLPLRGWHANSKLKCRQEFPWNYVWSKLFNHVLPPITLCFFTAHILIITAKNYKESSSCVRLLAAAWERSVLLRNQEPTMVFHVFWFGYRWSRSAGTLATCTHICWARKNISSPSLLLLPTTKIRPVSSKTRVARM